MFKTCKKLSIASVCMLALHANSYAVQNTPANGYYTNTTGYSSPLNCVTKVTQTVTNATTFPNGQGGSQNLFGTLYYNLYYFPAFNQIATPANGGVLCPGIYTFTNSCVIDSSGGCGGSSGSCGWNAILFLNSFFTPLAWQASHQDIGAEGNGDEGPGAYPSPNCIATHGNICENDPSVTIHLSNTSLLVDDSFTGVLFNGVYIESNSGVNYRTCTLTATMSSPAT